MPDQESPARLSGIATSWQALRQAQQGTGSEAAAAQQLLLERYRGAVYRYLLASLRDPHAADDLTQEFGLCLVRGDFHNAEPERGRFRDYVKKVLYHLICRYHRQRGAPLAPLPETGTCADDTPTPTEEYDRAFYEGWRDDLLARSWAALLRVQPLHHAVLRLRTQQPQMPSHEMAERLSQDQAKKVSPAAVRQMLHRAREEFADLLLEEVARSLTEPTIEKVEEELRDLNLWSYCQLALAKKAHVVPAP